MAKFLRITTEDLLDRVKTDSKTQIIDVRPVEFYNGWKRNNEPRGGHIKGARSLPVKWIDYLDWPDIVHGKGIQSDHNLVVYSDNPTESEKVAEKFFKLGYSNIFIYDEFVGKWSRDNSLPMDRLARHKHLVSAEWLHELMVTGTAAEFDNNKFFIAHGHYKNQNDYDIGHIPTAISVDTNLLESQVTWNRRSPEELREVLESLGITHDTTVIFYGRFSSPNNDDPFPGSSAGHLASIRCAFIMLYAGVNDVRILNGGIQSWMDAGYELTTEPTLPTPVSDFGVKIPANPYYAVDIEEAKEILKSDNANLVSVRSWPEFIGEVSGYNYIEKKGRIPGAVFGNCGSDAYHMENYRNLDHTMREFNEVKKLWEEVGIVPEKHNAYYCGTGWRGSEAFFNAWLMGWPNVSVFDGGWFEWSNDPLNPIETGVPVKK